MNNQYDLSKFVSPENLFLFEGYVMSYLRALAQQVTHQNTYGGDHPLNFELHLPPGDAYLLLRDQEGLRDLQKLLNCEQKQVFERLRDRIDEWDGVRIPDSIEVVDLVETDCETLLLSDEALRFAARYLNCSPEGVLGTLFDPVQIYTDLTAVSNKAHFANNDVYRILRQLAGDSELRKKIRSSLALRDWWDVLENWVKPSIQGQLAATLSQQSGNRVSKANVLHELFRLVKIAMGAGLAPSKQFTKFIQASRLGKMLPGETSKFWQTLKDFSTENTGNLNLDGLSEENVAKNSTEANAKEALRVAEDYMQTYVHPIQHELGQIDMLGMIALRHRFQGIIEELLSNALHYASLDSDVQNQFSYIQDAIRYYCHGEYKIALSNLLNVPFLTLEQMGVEYHFANENMEVEKESPIVVFSSEDNPFPGLGIIKSAGKPPRTIKRDELMIALQIGNRAIEILSLDHLEKSQIGHIKAAFPKKVEGLVENDSSLGERMVKTPFPVSDERKKVNDAIKSQIGGLVRVLVLCGTSFSLGRLIPSKDVFNKIPKPLSSEKTLQQIYSLEKLGNEIVTTYQADGLQISRISGA